ncbi:MAG: hypothetical protein ACYTBW_07510 [Planctomycetota bacterium]
MDPSIFKAYDVRGLYQEQLDEQAAWKIGHATAQFLRSMVHGDRYPADVFCHQPPRHLRWRPGDSQPQFSALQRV